MSSATPEQLENAIRSKKLGKVYLFDGPELFLKENITKKIIAALLPKEAQDLNLNRYHADSLIISEVLSTVSCMPFLAEKRVVVVQEAEDLAASEQKLMAEALSNLPDSTCLIFFHDGRASLKDEVPAQVASLGQIITFWTPFENQLPAWVANEIKKRGKSIDFSAAQKLAEGCSDLQEMAHEIDKLMLFVGEKKNIAAEDLNCMGLPMESGDFQDLEHAIWRRNLPEALNQGHLLSGMGVRPESIFPVFERVLRLLILGHYYEHEKNLSVEEIFTTLRMKGKTRQELFRSGMRAYSREELTQGMGKIVKADYDNKTGGLPGEMALTLLIFGVIKKAGVMPAKFVTPAKAGVQVTNNFSKGLKPGFRLPPE